jgi:hypothetical protein
MHVDEAQSIAMHSTGEEAQGSSPGSHIFNRDNFLNPLIADWDAITQIRQHLSMRISREKTRKERAMIMLPRICFLSKSGSLKKWAKEQVVCTK